MGEGDSLFQNSVNLLVPLIRGAKWDKGPIRTIFEVVLWPKWRRACRGAGLRASSAVRWAELHDATGSVSPRPARW